MYIVYIMNTIIEQKQSIREHYIAVRKALKPGVAERKSVLVASNILSFLQLHGAETVLVYHKIGAEADTSSLMSLILDSGLSVALPYCRSDGGLGVGRILNPRTDLVVGTYGIMEPAERLRDNISPDRLSAVVCPGIAFDAALTRLGRGKGYYDRFLRTLGEKTLTVGCAFDCQISPEPLPRESHDVRMDAVIAETMAFPVGCCPAIKPPEEVA